MGSSGTESGTQQKLGLDMGLMRSSAASVASRLYAAIDRRPQLLVMTFHRAGRECAYGPEIVERNLAFLAEHYTTVLPSQLPSVAGKRRIALVTVDDGHADLYETIFPIARRLGVPVTACVPTDFFLRKRWLWFDMVRWVLNPAEPGAGFQAGPVKGRVGLNDSVEALFRCLRGTALPERDGLIEQIARGLGVEPPLEPPEGFRPVEVEHMQAMLATGLLEVCSHTVSHTELPLLSGERLWYEVSQSKRALEEFCGRRVISFCYPTGGPGHFNEKTRQVVREAGYKIAFTQMEGLNRPSYMELLELKRIHAQLEHHVLLKMASGLGDVQRALGLAEPF